MPALRGPAPGQRSSYNPAHPTKELPELRLELGRKAGADTVCAVSGGDRIDRIPPLGFDGQAGVFYVENIYYL